MKMSFDLPQLQVIVEAGGDPIGQTAEVPVINGVSVETNKC